MKQYRPWYLGSSLCELEFLFYFLLGMGLSVMFSSPVHAFQSFFNVPTSEITRKGHSYFQQQLSVGDALVLNVDTGYGLAHLWEVGLSVNQFHISYSEVAPDQVPVLLVTLQKRFPLSDVMGLAIGIENGFRPGYSKYGFLASQGYFHWALGLPKFLNLRMALGVYYANGAVMAFDSFKVGLEGGIQFEVLPHRLEFAADAVAGATPFGYVAVGGVYWLSPGINTSVGFAIPWPKSQNSYAVVFELTFLNLPSS